MSWRSPRAESRCRASGGRVRRSMRPTRRSINGSTSLTRPGRPAAV
jgi:hypothetical protein